jgi:hypothetical protein
VRGERPETSQEPRFLVGPIVLTDLYTLWRAICPLGGRPPESESRSLGPHQPCLWHSRTFATPIFQTDDVWPHVVRMASETTVTQLRATWRWKIGVAKVRLCCRHSWCGPRDQDSDWGCYNMVQTPTLCKPDTLDRPCYFFSTYLI